MKDCEADKWNFLWLKHYLNCEVVAHFWNIELF